MPTAKLFVSMSGKKNLKDMHSSFACILYFKEFQESIVNVKKTHSHHSTLLAKGTAGQIQSTSNRFVFRTFSIETRMDKTSKTSELCLQG